MGKEWNIWCILKCRRHLVVWGRPQAHPVEKKALMGRVPELLPDSESGKGLLMWRSYPLERWEWQTFLFPFQSVMGGSCSIPSHIIGRGLREETNNILHCLIYKRKKESQPSCPEVARQPTHSSANKGQEFNCGHCVLLNTPQNS